MQKSNKLKGRGIVKLITIKEEDLKEGITVIGIYPNGVHKIGKLIDNDHKFSIEAGDQFDDEEFSLPSIRTLVVEYQGDLPLKSKSGENYDPYLKQLPIKQSQWQKVLDNNEIGKEIEFVIQDEYDYEGEVFPLTKQVAKIIPSKVDKVQERYEKALASLKLSHDSDKNWNYEYTARDVDEALKIAAGIKDK